MGVVDLKVNGMTVERIRRVLRWRMNREHWQCDQALLISTQVPRLPALCYPHTATTAIARHSPMRLCLVDAATNLPRCRRYAAAPLR